jgi:hypothetical protein
MKSSTQSAISQHEYQLQQEMLTLSYIAYVGMWGEASRKPAVLAALIESFLQKLKPVQGNWELAWGPAIFESSQQIFSAQNMMFVVRDTRQPCRFAVVVRGTDPLNLANITMEVDAYNKQEPWPYGKPPANLTPMIAEGVQTGLNILQTIQPVSGLPGAGLTLSLFLAWAGVQAAEGAKNPVPTEVVTTGHSLGGALSPVLALWLADTITQWRPDGKASVSSVPFAGFSPGNADMSSYYEDRLGAVTQRVYQSLDVVPHMYASAQMKQISTVYAPLIPYSAMFELTSQAAIISMELAGISYTQLQPETAPLTGSLYKDQTGFLGQMLTQHVQGYIDLLGLTDEIDVKELLGANR